MTCNLLIHIASFPGYTSHAIVSERYVIVMDMLGVLAWWLIYTALKPSLKDGQVGWLVTTTWLVETIRSSARLAGPYGIPWIQHSVPEDNTGRRIPPCLQRSLFDLR
jgi:hypothetical protein